MNGIIIDLGAIAITVLVLVSIANRVGVPYPLFLVLGGIGLGYVPGIPALQMPPEIVLLVFLPPLLYWESVSAPTSELFSRSGLWWILQLAFGLVVVTTLAVAGVVHALIPAMTWGTALVLGAIVSSTDEVAFAPIVERVRLPRHVLATIENESLINDATSLVLYGIGITAVVTGTFTLPGALASLVLSIAGGTAIGIVAGFIGIGAWRLTRDSTLQSIVSLSLPYLAYFSAWHLGASAVLATVATGFTIAPYIPKVLTPASRIRATGFWVTIVFLLNAFIFVYAGMQFRPILGSLHMATPALLLYGAAVAATCIVVRLLWVVAQGLVSGINGPQDSPGNTDWSHVSVLAWSGMRGGISLAAALAIPLETMVGPFPHRELIIFLTFCTMIGTLFLQGGTLWLVIRWLDVGDDGADSREERIALTRCSKAALARLEDLSQRETIPPKLYDALKIRFTVRLAEFSTFAGDRSLAKASDQYRHLAQDLLMVQRSELITLTKRRTIDNTVMRRILRLLDFEAEEIAILEMAGHAVDEDDSSDS